MIQVLKFHKIPILKPSLKNTCPKIEYFVQRTGFKQPIGYLREHGNSPT
jgi:hypothetical protein